MLIVYDSSNIEINKGVIENCLEITVKKEFENSNLFYQTCRVIEEHIASTETSKMICIFSNVENFVDIKRLTIDFYPNLVKLGITKVAIVTAKKLNTRPDHYKLRNLLKSMFAHEKLEFDLFFEIDNARMWIRNGT
jgi:hypothetical protein